MKRTRLILVGGFLGAGKTTLLHEAARRIMNRGLRIGLITNDQAPELVDTVFLSRGEVKVEEVSGSCFCCNFNGLTAAVQKVQKTANANVILAEPVGSCTDLSATIVQPLKEYTNNELIISPLSVLADPFQLTDILNGGNAGLHPSSAYIFRKQLEECDIIVISKAELLSSNELERLKQKLSIVYPDTDIMVISSEKGIGIDEWLNEVLSRNDAGQRLAEVDYEIYAEGESVLGWLNSQIELNGQLSDWDDFVHNFMYGLSRQFDDEKISVGHVKIILEAGDSYLTANFTGKQNTLRFRGSAGKGQTALLTINARAGMSPKKLEQIVKTNLESAKGNLYMKYLTLRCLSPGRPEPTFRYDHLFPIMNAKTQSCPQI